MSEEFKRTEHSDILVNWTGYDIDKEDPRMQRSKFLAHRKFCLKPIERPSLIDDHEIIRKYLERLRDTLKFGMWMVDEKPLEKGVRIVLSSSRSKHDGRGYNNKKVYVARTCFTELKLSEARSHAYDYGRLGFGVKRTYLYRRAGIPMIYFKNRLNSNDHPNWISEVVNNNEFASNYLKYLSEKEDMNDKYYSESEWRIICPTDSLVKHKVLDDETNGIKNLIVDAKAKDLFPEVEKYGNIFDNKESKSKFKEELKEFIKDNEGKFRYLLPFDFELAVIIYPSPKIKILAENDCEIRKLIKKTRYWSRKVKNEETGKIELKIERFYNKYRKYRRFLKELDKKKIIEDLKNDLGGTGERMMFPMEIDLDTISHF